MQTIETVATDSTVYSEASHYPHALGYHYPAGWLCQHCHDHDDPNETGPLVGADPTSAHPPLVEGHEKCLSCLRAGPPAA